MRKEIFTKSFIGTLYMGIPRQLRPRIRLDVKLKRYWRPDEQML